MTYSSAAELLPDADLTLLSQVELTRRTFPSLVKTIWLEDLRSDYTVGAMIKSIRSNVSDFTLEQVLDLKLDYDANDGSLSFLVDNVEPDADYKLRLEAALKHKLNRPSTTAPTVEMPPQNDDISSLLTKVLSGKGTADDRRRLINDFLLRPVVD
jgi:hypothetical protein